MLKYLVFLFIQLSFTCWAETSSHHPQEFVQGLKDDPHAGEKIYQQFCSNCHAQKPIIPVGAPAIGDEKAWVKRLSKGQKTLLENTLNGYGVMPARGGCFECSDEQIQMAINYILDSSIKH